VALEALYEFCTQTNRKRRPRRESPDFKVVDKVMEWWLGDEWRNSTVDQQEKHLRSATQWANQRVKRTRHRLVDESVLQSRLGLLLQMASNGHGAASVVGHPPLGVVHHPRGLGETHVTEGGVPVSRLPQFRGSARDWAAQLGLAVPQGGGPPMGGGHPAYAARHPHHPHMHHPGGAYGVVPPGAVAVGGPPRGPPPGVPVHVPPCAVDPHTPHSLHCGHPPVKVRSLQGETSVGFVVNRAPCCASSGNLLCDAHAGIAVSGENGQRPLEYATVAHGDHVDFVIDGHLTHPTSELTDDGQLLWEDCGELLELDEDTINDMYNILV